MRGEKHLRGVLIAVLLGLFLAWGPQLPQTSWAGPPGQVQAADVVSTRLAEVKKAFPAGSRINQTITIWSIVDDGVWKSFMGMRNGGCNAMVSYATLKIFHTAYIPGATTYKKLGTAKISSTSALNKLFKKAKKGDVIRWHNGSNDYHFAIFLSKSGNGVKVYEGNFGPKNKVWYNHLWKYSSMKSWTHGASQVSVYRSKNYSQVQKKKAAKNLKKGAKFTYKGITYKVTTAGIRNGAVKVVKKDATAGKTPKAIGINYDQADVLAKYGKSEWDEGAARQANAIRIRSYSSNKGHYYDEQYFVVK